MKGRIAIFLALLMATVISLVLRTVTGDPPGDDLPTLRNEEPENSRVLIIDIDFLVGTESTDFPP